MQTIEGRENPVNFAAIRASWTRQLGVERPHFSDLRNEFRGQRRLLSKDQQDELEMLLENAARRRR